MKCLDTSILIDAMKDRPGARRAVEAAAEGGVATTEINVFEVYVGAYREGRSIPREIQAIERGLGGIDVLPLTRSATLRAASLTSLLRSRGQEVGTLDVLVAGIAMAHDIDTIVTSDDRHFGRIPGIRVETY